MALPNDKITTSLVANTLQVSTRDVGTLCTHPSINKWSKRKPVPLASVAANVDPWEIATPKYGINKPIYNSISEMLLGVYGLNSISWDYVKPLSHPTFPARLGDFRGYEHSAIKPFSITIPEYVEETYPNTFVEAKLNLPIVGIDNVSAQDLRLGWYYFGAVLINTDNPNNVVSAKVSENTIEDYFLPSSDEIYVYLNNQKSGRYRIIPFLSDSDNLAQATEIIPIETDNLTFTYGAGVELNMSFERYRDDGFVRYSITLTNITNTIQYLGNITIQLRYQDSLWTNPLIDPPYEEYARTWSNVVLQPYESITFTPDEPEQWLHDTSTHGEEGLIRFEATQKRSLTTYGYLVTHDGNSPAEWWD